MLNKEELAYVVLLTLSAIMCYKLSIATLIAILAILVFPILCVLAKRLFKIKLNDMTIEVYEILLMFIMVTERACFEMFGVQWLSIALTTFIYGGTAVIFGVEELCKKILKKWQNKEKKN